MNNKPKFLGFSRFAFVAILGFLTLLFASNDMMAQNQSTAISALTPVEPSELEDLRLDLADYRLSVEQDNSLTEDQRLSRIFITKRIDRYFQKGVSLQSSIELAFSQLDVVIREELGSTPKAVNVPLIREEIENELL